MSLSRALPFLAVPLALAACAAPRPYYISDYLEHQNGTVRICYDATYTQRDKLLEMAEEICQRNDRTAKFWLQQSYQCDWQTPSLITYQCVARPGEKPNPLTTPQRAPLRHNNQRLQ